MCNDFIEMSNEFIETSNELIGHSKCVSLMLFNMGLCILMNSLDISLQYLNSLKYLVPCWISTTCTPLKWRVNSLKRIMILVNISLNFTDIPIVFPWSFFNIGLDIYTHWIEMSFQCLGNSMNNLAYVWLGLDIFKSALPFLYPAL